MKLHSPSKKAWVETEVEQATLNVVTGDGPDNSAINIASQTLLAIFGAIGATAFLVTGISAQVLVPAFIGFYVLCLGFVSWSINRNDPGPDRVTYNANHVNYANRRIAWRDVVRVTLKDDEIEIVGEPKPIYFRVSTYRPEDRDWILRQLQAPFERWKKAQPTQTAEDRLKQDKVRAQLKEIGRSTGGRPRMERSSRNNELTDRQ